MSTAARRHCRRARRFALAAVRSRAAAASLIAIAVFVILLCSSSTRSRRARFSYFDLSFMSAGGATLALAAMGQTLVILTGGFDLSAGAVISLVNVVLATEHGHRARARQVVLGLAALGDRRAGRAPSTASSSPSLRLQPIVVTLSTMFIVQGITLLVMDKPGGAIAPESRRLPRRRRHPRTSCRRRSSSSLVAVAAWLLVKHSRFGIGVYAVGSDEDAAHAAGHGDPAGCKFCAYVLAGGLYGARRRLHQRPDRLGRSADRRPAAAARCSPRSCVGGTVLGGGRGGPSARSSAPTS